LKSKRIVISGGPGSGKTSLISYLEKEGHTCMHEISRDVIIAAQKEGITQLFLENPLLFSQKLLEGRLQQFIQASEFSQPFVFYDRGMPDITAYMNYIDSHYPLNFTEICCNHRYDAVFLLPPWKAIYRQDNERYESFEQAEALCQFLLKSYQKFGYTVIEVPVGPIEKRIDFMLDKLKTLF
jgi:predicted ATPase|tara:strand:- start:685 stop:1230 length:546 start_codon:yes stop_codon:yes gene_type:complete